MTRADEARRLKVRANADTPASPPTPSSRAPRDRAVPDRAHVPRRGAGGRRPDDDLRRLRGRGRGRLRHPPAPPARRLRRHLPGHGRQAGHRAPAGPAAARVPARPGRLGRGRRPGQGRGGRRWRSARQSLPLDEAAEMLAKVNDLHEANPMLGLRGVRLGILKPGQRHAGPGHRRGGRGQGQGRRRHPDRGDHDPAGRHPRGAVPGPRGSWSRSRRALADQGQGLESVGDDDRTARAALVAGEIAEVAEFFSYGTTTSPRPRSGSPATTSASSSASTRSCASWSRPTRS